MSKARELLAAVSQSSDYEATVSEAALSAFSDASIGIDILPSLLEDIAYTSKSNITLDVKDEQLVIKIDTNSMSDRVTGVCDTQKLFEDLGFHLEQTIESSSSVELLLRV